MHECVCVCVYCLVECTNFEIDEDIIGGWGRGGELRGGGFLFPHRYILRGDNQRSNSEHNHIV